MTQEQKIAYARKQISEIVFVLKIGGSKKVMDANHAELMRWIQELRRLEGWENAI